MTYLTFTRKDASDEKAVSSIRVVDILADGTNYPTITGAQSTIQTAIDGVTNGIANQQRIVASDVRLTNVVPSDDSRRETKWLCSYEDDTTFEIFNVTLPCSDWTNANRAGTTDFWDLTNETAQMTAMRLALENNMLSPNGNSITLLSVEDVGRNN